MTKRSLTNLQCLGFRQIKHQSFAYSQVETFLTDTEVRAIWHAYHYTLVAFGLEYDARREWKAWTYIVRGMGVKFSWQREKSPDMERFGTLDSVVPQKKINCTERIPGALQRSLLVTSKSKKSCQMFTNLSIRGLLGYKHSSVWLW